MDAKRDRLFCENISLKQFTIELPPLRLFSCSEVYETVKINRYCNRRVVTVLASSFASTLAKHFRTELDHLTKTLYDFQNKLINLLSIRSGSGRSFFLWYTVKKVYGTILKNRSPIRLLQSYKYPARQATNRVQTFHMQMFTSF